MLQDVGWIQARNDGHQGSHFRGHDYVPAAWAELRELLPDVRY